MEALRHNIVLSESTYKYNFLEIFYRFFISLLRDKMFFCFTRQKFKSNDKVKLNNPFFKNFFLPVKIPRNNSQELTAAIDFASTLLIKCSVTNGNVDSMLLHDFSDAIDILKSKQNG